MVGLVFDLLDFDLIFCLGCFVYDCWLLIVLLVGLGLLFGCCVLTDFG